ncbi:MAG TPA: hypothetical protein VMU80_01675 [Bryobacteraceae bacterium]|nr:hypothetical protein [Bryobacteraceae bacterium]
MAVLRPRERLVYFRISEDEFRQFVSVCEQAGARSVSDLARNAVQRLIADGQRQREDQELDEKIRLLERMIAAVSEQLRVLATNQAAEAPLTLTNGTQTVGHNGRKEEQNTR